VKAGSGDVDVWFAHIPSLSPFSYALAALLTPEERRSREGSGDAGTRRRPRLVGRCLLRALLGLYTDQDPAEIALVAHCPACGGAHGPPRIAGLGPVISASYARDVAVVAFAPGPVGVDVEEITPSLQWRDIARVAFAPAACSGLERLAPDAAVAGFFAAWTAHEALGKALGTGMTLDGAELERRAREGGVRWSVRRFSPRPGYVASVAASNDSRSRARVVSPELVRRLVRRPRPELAPLAPQS